MFHVKHFVCILLLLPFFALSQGSISMKDKVVSYPLKEDISLRQSLISSSSYNSLTSEEQQVLYYMNYARKNPSLFLTNAIDVFLTAHPEVVSNYTRSLQTEFKKLTSLPIILPDAVLSNVSRGHAKDLGSHNVISHTSTNGKTFQQRVQSYVKECASECIHATQRFDAVECILSLLFDFNVPDLGHRKTLLNPKYSVAGLGLFSKPQANTVVVIDFSCK